MNGFIDTAKRIITPNQYAQELNDKIKQEEKTQHCEKVYVYIDNAMEVELQNRKAQDKYKTYTEKDIIEELKAEKKFWETSCISEYSQRVWKKPGYSTIEPWIQTAVQNGINAMSEKKRIENRDYARDELTRAGIDDWAGGKKISSRKKSTSTRGKRKKPTCKRNKSNRKKNKRYKK